MGVWGLQTYIENACPDACQTVSLKEMADAHRRIFDCRPELVVDGMNFVCKLLIRSGLEWIYDAQWLQFKEHLKESVEKFRKIDVKLVFFFDGTVCSSKRDTWRQRRLQNYEKIKEIFEDIENFGQLSEERKDESVSRTPISTRIVSSFLLRELEEMEGELGSKVFQTDREADEEMVHYAKSDNVFGILSQDTDFMIYDTKDYFSIKHLNMDTLETIFYDRRCLARKLRLKVEQLPLFACLLGNNSIPYDKLKKFHECLRTGKSQSRRIPSKDMRRVPKKALLHRVDQVSSISSLIREKIWNGNAIDWETLRSESKGVLGTVEKELIEKKSKSYVVKERVTPKPVNDIPRNLEEEILKRHADCSQTADIFNILFFREYGSTDVLEKVFDKAKTSVLIYREIRQRCYGILFNFSQIPSVYPRVVEEYCAYIGNKLDKPELVTPLPLKILIRGKKPAVDDIWFKYSPEEKCEVFWATLQLAMDLDTMKKIAKEKHYYLVFSCIINFLARGSSIGPHLEPFDVAVFVAQAVWEKNIPELKELQVQSIIPRAVNLTTLFMRGVAIVLLALGVCDYPFPFAYADPCHFFDGKQFHYLYSTAINEKRTVKYLCQTNNRTKLFYSLLEVVTNNTKYDIKKYNWKQELEDFELPELEDSLALILQ